MILSPREIELFRETVWGYYRAHPRSMPWRERPSPYFVLVSELMLQQTQVPRVIPKFLEFVTVFPDFSALAAAPLAAVLQRWSGLGYNRRAKFLHDAARRVMDQGGEMPRSVKELVALPGVGKNTAGAIMNYAYNIPTVFVETNIRTVYFGYFFANTRELIDDQELMSLVEQTMDQENPREWFWALMDYGTHLKKNGQALIQQSRHYKKQAPLKGSQREMRGMILRKLSSGAIADEQLLASFLEDERFETALRALQKEGLVETIEGRWCLTGDEQPS